MGSKGSNSTTQTQNQSWTADPRVVGSYLGLMGRAGQVADTPYQSYGGNLVAGFTPDQLAAFQTVRDSQDIAQPYLQQAQNYATMGAAPSYTNVQSYMSPYIQHVVDATRANFANTNAQQQQQVIGNAALQNALGGDRVGVAQAELAHQQSLAQDPIIAGLYNQGYTGALSAAQTDAWRAANAGYTFGNLGQTAQNLAFQGANAQYGMGTAQQQLAQAGLNVPYQQYLEQRAYPFQVAQWQTGIDTSLGPLFGGNSLGNTVTTPPKPNPLNQVLGGAMMAGSMFLKNGGRVGYADGGIAIPYAPAGPGGVPYIALTPHDFKPPTPMAGPAAAKPDNSASGLVNQAIGLAGKMKNGMAGKPLNINPMGDFTPSPVGTIAPIGDTPAAAMASMGIGPIYARGGAVRGGIYLPRRHYDDGGTVQSFDDRWAPVTDALNSGDFDPQGSNASFMALPPQITAPPPAPANNPTQDWRNSVDAVNGGPPTMAGFGTGSMVPMAYTAPSSSDAAPAAPADLGGSGPSELNPGGGAPDDSGDMDEMSSQSRRSAPSKGGFGLGILPQDLKLPLMAAGAAMMASKSPFVGQAIGEGGLAGIKTYTDRQDKDRTFGLQSKRVDLEAQRLKEAATKAANSLTETTRHNKASEGLARDRLDQENYQYVGVGEDGKPVYYDRRSGKEVVGENKITGRPGVSRTGQTENLIAELRKENPNLTYAEALALTKRAPSGDTQTLRRESLALSAAKADVGYLSDPDGTIEKYRQKYGLTGSGSPAPGGSAAPGGKLKPPPADVVERANAAIKAGKSRDAVIQRLRENGFNADGLNP